LENLTKFIEVYKAGTKSIPEIIQELKSTNSKNDKIVVCFINYCKDIFKENDIN